MHLLLFLLLCHFVFRFISYEMPKRRGLREYLVPTPCTWECEERFASQHQDVIDRYLSNWKHQSNLVKIEIEQTEHSNSDEVKPLSHQWNTVESKVCSNDSIATDYSEVDSHVADDFSDNNGHDLLKNNDNEQQPIKEEPETTKEEEVRKYTHRS